VIRPRSAQGRAVLAAVDALDHPTADQVFVQVRRTLPRVSLATVYRNLDALVRSGRIQTHATDGQKRFDPNTDPHLHLHDTRSGRLVDMPVPADLDRALRRLCAAHLTTTEDCIIEIRGTLKEPI
jgi:Fur family ferric uptake transcriptional regulator